MPFIPVPNTAAVSIGFINNGKPGSNNIHFSKATPWSLADLSALGTYIQTWFSTFPLAQAHTLFSWQDYRIMDLETASSPVLEQNFSSVITGLETSNPLPNNVAFVVTFRTVNRGRSFRGRIYQSGIAEAHCNGNLVTTTYANAIEGFWDYPASTTPPAGSWHSVVSRFSNNAPRAAGINTPVTGYDTNTQVDTQRRRMPN